MCGAASPTRKIIRSVFLSLLQVILLTASLSAWLTLSGVGLPLAIWLLMVQIFFLAASIRPLMLPVVSRQKTTSTRALTFSGLSLAGGALGSSAGDRPVKSVAVRIRL